MDDWLLERLKKHNKDNLTTIQKLAFENGIDREKSMVVCAPTSAGKTLVGEIAIACGIRKGYQALYLVSHKALADQKFDEFQGSFERVAVATGDRDDGDPEPQLLVATYEKALALIVSGSISINRTVVVADELQILGEEKRGPEIELLCTLIRSRKPVQFVALTATIENGNHLAHWLDCTYVHSSVRDVDLIQEIQTPTATYTQVFGQPEGDLEQHAWMSTDTSDVVERLIREKRGPVLVFVETRRDATELAASFSKKRARATYGLRCQFARNVDPLFASKFDPARNATFPLKITQKAEIQGGVS
jgi:helicase